MKGVLGMLVHTRDGSRSCNLNSSGGKGLVGGKKAFEQELAGSKWYWGKIKTADSIECLYTGCCSKCNGRNSLIKSSQLSF